MELRIADNVDVNRWDGLVSLSPAGNIFYTARWAETRREYLYTRPYYLTLMHDGAAMAIAVAEVAAIAHTRFYAKFFDRQILPLAMRHAPVIKMRDWIFICHGEKPDMAELVLKTKEAISVLGPFRAEIFENVLNENMPGYGEALIGHGFECSKWATFIVDVGTDIGTIYTNLKNSARKAIRKADEQGLSVTRVNDLDELKGYYRFFAKARRDMRLWIPPFEEMETMWKRLKGPGGSFEIFVAKEQDAPVGGIGIWAFNGIINEFGAVRSSYAARKGLFVGDIIKWEVIKWANSNGLRRYDLEGVAPQPQNTKDASIRQFKEKWGGEFRIQRIFRKIYPRGAFGTAVSIFRSAMKRCSV